MAEPMDQCMKEYLDKFDEEIQARWEIESEEEKQLDENIEMS
jgi:hypothetical protein